MTSARVLTACILMTVDISIHVSPTILNSSAEWLTVTVEIEDAPLPYDWIGIYSPPVNGTIDYHNQVPIKFQVREMTCI